MKQQIIPFQNKKLAVYSNDNAAKLGGDLILQLTDKLNHCKGVVILNTPPVSKPPAMEKALLPNPLVGMFFTKEYDKANVQPLAEVMFTDVKNIPDFVALDFERTDGNMRQALAEAVGAGNYNDEVLALGNTKIAVMLISGQDEKLVNNTYFETLQVPMLFKGHVHYVPHAAHCPQWENAGSFNKLVSDFCK